MSRINVRSVNINSELIATPGTSMRRVTIGAAAAAEIVADLNAATTYIFVDVRGGDARLTYTGQDPVATSLGHNIYAGANFTQCRTAAIAAKWISELGGNVFLNITEMTTQ